MFLHLGEDVIILKKSVIGIFDKKKCYKAVATKEFCEIAKSEKKMIKIGTENNIKTLIITDKNLYLSPISSITLIKRFNKNYKSNVF